MITLSNRQDASPGPVTELGSRVIFLISQPRAGSTMLQRMLSRHPAIHSTSEPWILLHPLSALRPEGITATFDAKMYRQAVAAFLGGLPAGEADYYAAVRQMANYLYGRALAGAGKTHFLDKTPRYYSIIPELARTFPEAKFIFLQRHPLAVLTSILRTWVRGKRSRLKYFHADLREAPQQLVAGAELVEQRGHVVRYEDLLRSPVFEMKRLCTFLGMDFCQEQIHYGGAGQEISWAFGDQDLVHCGRPVAEHGDKWEDDLRSPWVWRQCREYLDHLGAATLARMGYSHATLLKQLNERRPSTIGRLRSIVAEFCSRSTTPAVPSPALGSKFRFLSLPEPFHDEPISKTA